MITTIPGPSTRHLFLIFEFFGPRAWKKLGLYVSLALLVDHIVCRLVDSLCPGIYAWKTRSLNALKHARGMQDGLKTRPFFALFISILKHAEDDETRENSGTDVQIVAWYVAIRGGRPIVPSPPRWFDGSSAPQNPRNDEGWNAPQYHNTEPSSETRRFTIFGGQTQKLPIE